MTEVDWTPRDNNVILKAVLKEEIAKRAVKAPENNFEDYLYYVYKCGPKVDTDLQVGDEVFLNLANLKPIYGLTSRKEEVTFYFTIDQVISMKRPGIKI